MSSASPFVVTLSGEAGLRGAQELAATLRQALANRDSIAIATQAISGADITTIQLLLAARKQAALTGKSVTLADAPTGALREALVANGCISADGRAVSDDGNFWTPDTNPREGKAA